MESDGLVINDSDIVRITRVGISKARDWPLRFYVRWSPYVSKKIREGS